MSTEPINGQLEMTMRHLGSLFADRAQLAALLGQTFGGQRKLYTALGYTDKITPADYRARYDRGGIAKSIVDAYPNATWRGGGEVIEVEDPETETAFEKAFFELNMRLSLWSVFKKADILAGLGRYSVIFLGAPGDFATPLERCRPEELQYVRPYSERNVTVESYEADRYNPRFGHPVIYNVTLPYADGRTTGVALGRVHHSRIIHVAEGSLDDPLFGPPRLEACWNDLDNLDKVVGGGSEAYFRRVDAGRQFKLDPNMPMPTEPELAAFDEKLDRYTHGLEKNLKTRGIDVEDLGSQVANFGPNVAAILDLLSAISTIPQRILMGSERGQLASSQDESNFDDRVDDRRADFANTQIVRPTIDRLIALGVLPKPESYEAWWPERNPDDAERMLMAKTAAEVNNLQGQNVFPSAEIRDKIMDWDPIDDEDMLRDELDVSVEEDDPAVRSAARSPVKAVRLLRLYSKGRRKLKGRRK